MRILFGVIACLALVACADRMPQIQDAPWPAPKASPVDLRPMCVTVKTYTAQEMESLARAIQALPDDSPIVPAIGDYKRMRDEGRACAAAAGDSPR